MQSADTRPFRDSLAFANDFRFGIGQMLLHYNDCDRVILLMLIARIQLAFKELAQSLDVRHLSVIRLLFGMSL